MCDLRILVGHCGYPEVLLFSVGPLKTSLSSAHFAAIGLAEGFAALGEEALALQIHMTFLEEEQKL